MREHMMAVCSISVETDACLRNPDAKNQGNREGGLVAVRQTAGGLDCQVKWQVEDDVGEDNLRDSAAPTAPLVAGFPPYVLTLATGNQASTATLHKSTVEHVVVWRGNRN